MSNKNLRSRNFCFELYPDDDFHLEILDYIMSYFDFAYILHDSDIFDSDVLDDNGVLIHKAGDLKKPHYHVIISFKNSRSVNSLLDELHLNHIETCNFYAYCRYLIHLDSPQKFQYDKNLIHTNMSVRVSNALSRNFNFQEQDTRILLNFIFDHQGEIITFKRLTEYAMENDCLLDLKRNTFFYKQFTDNFGFNRW